MGLENVNGNINKPTLINSLSGKNIVKIICGARHTFAILVNFHFKYFRKRSCFWFGYNAYGQFGNKNFDDIWTPTLLNFKIQRNNSSFSSFIQY